MATDAGSALRLLTVAFVGLVCASGCGPSGPKIDPRVSDNHYYNLFRTKVIFGRAGNCFELGCWTIEGADAHTFRPLNGRYAVDKNRVYYERRAIAGERPESFRLSAGPYAVGTRGVYWFGEIIPVEDPESFHAVEFNRGDLREFYGVDSSGVYCRDRKISNRPNSFRGLDLAGYFSDTGNVYYIAGGVCETLGADPGTFEFLKKTDNVRSVYAKDSMHVYGVFVGPLKNQVIEGADVETFEVLCAGIGPPHYARDKHHVYDFGRIVEGADPASFPVAEKCEKSIPGRP